MTGSIISDNARSHTTAIISAIILCVTCVLCFFLVMLTTASALVLLAEVTCKLMGLVTTETVFFCMRLDGGLPVPSMLGLFSSPIAASIFLSSFIKQAEQRSLIWQFRWVAFLMWVAFLILWAFSFSSG